jgi:sodium-dependent phosphate cotransporter
MTVKQKSILAHPILRAILALTLLYAFLVSIKLMGASFKQFGDVAKQLIMTAENPFVGLMIGILATSIVQSSSTTTATVVGLVGSGLLPLPVAIPMIMGANIGTSVTNTIVSLGNITKKDEFHRSFSASTVHDFFNFIAVIVFFPLQLYTGFLTKASTYMADVFVSMGGFKTTNYFKVIIKPAVKFIKTSVDGNASIMLVIAFALMFVALHFLSKLLKNELMGSLNKWFDKVMFKNAATSFLLGIIITVAVQSSSITTSVIVPLAGAGVLSLEQIFPYTLGANLGTTITAILASLAIGNPVAIAVAFAHLLFNIFGTLLIYPLRAIPIAMARGLATLAIKNKMYPIAYVALAFFILPVSLMYFTK